MPGLIIRPSRGLRGAAAVPGDKSISHRALLLGAIADGETQVRGWLPAEDCQATLRCVRALGVQVDGDDPPSGSDPRGTTLRVRGVGLEGLREPEDVLDCGGSGTTMRLLAGLLAGQEFTSLLTGNPALRRRPMGRVAEPLRRMGATILGRDGGRLPPLAIHGGRLRGIEYAMPVASAQVKSALLLAALYAEGATVVVEPGPSRDHTERMLRHFGVHLGLEGRRISLTAGERLKATPAGVTVPGDFSAAAFPLVAAAIVPGSRVRLVGVGVNPTRTGLLDLLQGMGADIATAAAQPGTGADAGEPIADLSIAASDLQAVDVGGDLIVRAIDEFPVFAVAATQAAGLTTVREASELRVKESDRISAVVAELLKMGADITERPDGFVVKGPAPLRGAAVDSHGDHRLAMALAVAGLVAQGATEVRNAEVINDSFPGFVETMRGLGADIAWV